MITCYHFDNNAFYQDKAFKRLKHYQNDNVFLLLKMILKIM